MKIHEIKGYIQSIYLVEYPDKFLLLDGCTRRDVKVVYNFITKKLQRSINDLKLVVVTHQHPDHAGGANAFKKQFGCKIATTKKANDWYRGPSGLIKFIIDLILTFYVAKKMGKKYENIFYSRFVKYDYELKDNDVLPLFSDWTVLFRPGHTDCDLTLFHKESGSAYIADNIIKIRSKYIIPYPVNFPDIYIQSLNSYKADAFKKFYLAHGGSTQISPADIDEIISKVSHRPVNHNQLFKRLFRNAKKHNYFK
ncbi:metallo-beta-lactamase domain protein [Bacteriovorax sp. BSW11_IV]|nr:metallo-beta-lactamase domain protein [Bacteriovorax sp. BSW11_IV]